jgi:glutamate synthase (NADPH/NADH) small chain
MDRQQVRDWEARCIQEQPPACTAACPVHVDVRKMIECVRKGDFADGFAVLARSIPFPGIISRICDHPCEAACKRGEAGDVIKIRALEQACTDYAYKSAAPTTLSTKGKQIAVVGGGLSGLTAAVDLAVKGYDIVVFEARARLLERLLKFDHDVLPQSVVFADLAVLQKLGVQIRSNSWIGSGQCHSLTEEFDAVYLGLGPESFDPGGEVVLQPNGRLAIDPLTFATSHPKVFAGGTHRYSPAAFSPITSLQDGRYAALSIDRFLQGASLSASRENQGPFTSRLYVNTRREKHSSAIAAANSSRGYTKDEAIREAQRCFPCQCLECVKVCEYLAHYKSYPKRYVREIYNNDCIVMGVHPSNRMVNTCSLCGLCEAVCPEKLSMGEVCMEARQSMVKRGKMPPSAHDFALRDMAFSRSEAFTLARHQPGFASSAAVFFPGCQLSASSPDHVLRAYDYLQKNIAGGVGLMLGCCGAPARWSGDQALFRDVLRSVKDEWERMGQPRMITACSTCYRMFKDNLPDIRIESLWTVFDRCGLPTLPRDTSSRTLAIHDPCTTRHEEDVQDSVRRITAKLGVKTVELNERGLTTCCGYGGLMQFADAAVADKVVNRRIHQSDADYVTYCAMCRDNFSRRGKRTVHILDLIFESSGPDPAARPDPGFSARQENRAHLKAKLLREVWKETAVEEEQHLNLVICPELKDRLEKKMILVEDVRRVIAHAEATSEKILHPQTARFIASYRLAAVTYWVEYSVQQTEIVVHNAYSHRMQVG